ncbi:MAG: hypothetical protein ABL881_06580 [Novosphingobium sp.]
MNALAVAALVAAHTIVGGTDLSRREATPRIERLDLTEENCQAPKAVGG